MTTQYTPILQLALPVTGELNGTWGDVVNDNITSMVEEAIAGLATISTWVANSHTLTTADGTTDEARCAMLVATSTTAASEIICPARTKLFVLKNSSSYAVTLKTAAGTGVAVAAGETAFLFCDGTNVNACVTTIVNGHITGNLTVDGNATVNGNTTLGDSSADTVVINAGSTTINDGGAIRFEDNAGGEYVAIKAPATVTATYTLTLPIDDGINGQALITDGAGNLSWSTAASGDVYGPASATDNAVARFDGTTGKLIQNSAVTIGDDGATVIAANSSSDGLRITQTGAGNALLVEDSANPDSSPFVITGSGTVGIGLTNPGSYVTTGVVVKSAASFEPQIQLWNAVNDTSASYLSLKKDRSGAIVQSGDGIGNVDFQAFDGASMVTAARILSSVDGTPGTNDMPGRLVFSTTADGASTPTERMRIDNAGRVGIGGIPSTGINFINSKNITGSIVSYQNFIGGTVQSDVTSIASYNLTYPSTAAAAFTLTTLRHYSTDQGTIGAGSTVTNQYGFFANSSLTGATNNYGFYSAIASGTGRWNFYASGSADNYFSGNVLISAASLQTFGSIPAAVQVNKSTGTAAFASARWSNDTGGAYLIASKSRGTTVGTNVSVVSGDTAGTLLFTADDGSSFVQAASIFAAVDGTPGTNDMPGRLVFSTTADGASSPTERMRIDSAGRVGIGTIANSYGNFFLGKQLTGQVFNSAMYVTSTIASDVTNTASAYTSQLATSANAFTLSNINHFIASPSAKGAGSTITNQHGFRAESTLTDATNNYGFYSNIASGTGRYNFYAAGSADNYFAGSVGIGGASAADTKLHILGTLPSSSNNSKALFAQYTIPSTSTNQSISYLSYPGTQAASFNAAQIYHFYANQGTIGAGSTVTNQYGFSAESTLTGATNNYGFYSNIASGTGRYNFYAAGSADNYFAGFTGIGGVSNGFHRLCIYENTNTSASILCQTAANAANPGIAINRLRAGSAAVISGDVLGTINFTGWDGSTGSGQTTIVATADGTVSTGSVPTRITFSTTPSGSLTPTERMRITSSGSVGIGGTPFAGANFVIPKTVTGATNSYQLNSDYTVASDVTSSATTFFSYVQTQAAAFTLTTLNHFAAAQRAIGAGSTVTNQRGFISDSSLTGATNNYGFYSAIASGTGRYNFYAAGSADNYFAGSVGIGSTNLTGIGLRLEKTYTGSYNYAMWNQATFSGTVLDADSFTTYAITAASATVSNLRHYVARQSTIGAGSTVTNQHGFQADSNLTGATNNYGFHSNIASGTGRYNFYAAGSADNYFAGNVGIGTIGSGFKLDVSGNVHTTSNYILDNDNALYWGTGDGSTLIKGNSSSDYIAFNTASAERMRIDSSGNLIQTAPTTAPTLSTNGTMVFNLTSNTNLRVSVRGSDGVTRTANITLA